MTQTEGCVRTWNREHRAAEATRRIMAWLGVNGSDAEVAQLLERLQARQFDEVERLLTAMLPAESAADIADTMFGFR